MKGIQGVLMTGGKSSRMGVDKALLKLNDEYFADRIIRTMDLVCDDIMVIGPKFHQEKYGVNFHNDIHPEKGPAGAIYTALKHSQEEILLILSCDVPLIEESLIRKLIMAYKGEDALICRHNERIHPLIGIYNSRSLSAFQEAVESNNLRLMSIIKQIHFAFLDVHDSLAHQLTNVNTKQDYNKIIDEYSN